LELEGSEPVETAPEDADVSRGTEPEQIEVPEESVPAPTAASVQEQPEPEGLLSGMVARSWAGKKVWHCPRCGSDTFDRETAEAHACKGRQVKRYVEGE
jgi:hypothetical protein